MARTRALMTETDRDYISDPDTEEENKRYQAISRVRDRLDELEKDVSTLEKYHPNLLREVREIVCGEGLDSEVFDRLQERIEELERENQGLREQLEERPDGGVDVNELKDAIVGLNNAERTLDDVPLGLQDAKAILEGVVGDE